VELRAELNELRCDRRNERDAALVGLSLFEDRNVDEHRPLG
jgi:hypothetical protein